jgi:hypothetical protein
MQARAITVEETGFTVELPKGTSKGVPLPLTGKASLTFQGIETFVGDITARDGLVSLRVERALPIFPMTKDTSELWTPAADTRETLMRRLLHETQRRGQPVPTIPMERPLPTEGYQRRRARQQLVAPPDA